MLDIDTRRLIESADRLGAMALATLRPYPSAPSAKGLERMRRLVEAAGQRLLSMGGLKSVRHGRTVRPAWQIETNLGHHYVILISDTEAELYNGNSNRIICSAPAPTVIRSVAAQATQ
jgi:hypothetical protein